MLTKQPVLSAKTHLCAALKAALLLGVILPFAVTAEDTSRISVNSKGKQTSGGENSWSNGGSWHPSISADNRYVAFMSEASNLVPNDTNNSVDIFVHDRETKKTRRVSVSSDGTQAKPSWSSAPIISANGRYVAFRSDASNLIADDKNGTDYDVFIHDLKTKKTERISFGPDVNEADVEYYPALPALSADGRYVSFLASIANPDESNVFVHDRKTKTTTRASVASDGTPGNGSCMKQRISANGRYVAFQSEANNLVKGDTNKQTDIFVHDLVTKQTTRVSVASDGTQGNNGAWQPDISADGRYVTFWSSASNLVSDDNNIVDDVFVHDRETHETTRVSVASDGTQANGYSSRPTISHDGRYVGFTSAASNLSANDDNGVEDVFVHDRVTGTTKLVSVTLDGTSGTGSFSMINVTGNRDAIISQMVNTWYSDR
ncbi:hypothetical protein [Methylocucumis oryzae]|uniref:hypothetical protein n=1 Tax=Methylocucumis oryzae TaxID=1632867 RepID=UPI000698F53B|nr:hypothetical protein [Methylocucumis oryzae]